MDLLNFMKIFVLLMLVAITTSFPSNEKDLVVKARASAKDMSQKVKNAIHKFRKDWDDHWHKYKKNFLDAMKEMKGKEDELRAIWEERYEAIQKHNSQKDASYELGENEYSYMKRDEFSKKMKGYNSRSHRNFTGNKYSEDWKDDDDDKDDRDDEGGKATVDWRDKGIISPVKNQKNCGSCWAFAANGALEAYYAKEHGENVSLSEQNLIDCAQNDGCDGGDMDDAFQYVIKNGVQSEKSYPYEEDDDQKCKFKKDKSVVSAKKYINIPKGDEEALRKAVKKHGPVSVGINASDDEFQDYKGGIYDVKNCDPDHLDHAVLVVGYGTEKGKDYWLIKNSWGKSWGMNGYMKLIRNKNNTCGVATEAQYPVL